jgi:prepilin-type N-terminal cleavage/methylation domain-containing protein
MRKQHNSHSGFTLIELSIVIVIIGLIVAGVVAGQSLVKQSKLYSIITDVSRYKVSVNTFRLTYNAIPGGYD